MSDDVRRLLDRADGHRAAGRGADAGPLYAEATDLALAAGDLPAAIRAVLALARGQRFDVQPGLIPARLHDVYVRATEPADRARLAAALARVWAYASRPHRAAPFATTALELARAEGDPVLLADCLDATLTAHWGPDDLDRRRGWAQELDDVVAHLRDPQARLQAYLWALTVAWELLDLPRIHRHLRALEELGAADAEARFFAAPRRLAADLLLGRLDTAPLLREIAEEAAGQAFVADVEGIGHLMTAYPAMLRGDRATCAAEAAVYQEWATTEGAPTVLAEAGLLWAAAGRTDRAAAVAGQFGGDTLAGLPADGDWLLTVQCVLEAALAGGVREVVAAAVELLTPYENRAVINAGAVMFHGTTDDTLSRGNALLGNATAAARQRERALATYRRIGAVWWRERLEAAAPGGDAGRMRLRRAEGGLWSVGPDAAPVTVPGMRGLEYLHCLLSRPDTEIPALDLAGPQTVRQGGLGPDADARALAEYRRRLATAPPAERAAIEAHLRSVTGLGGRARESGSSAERARVAVRKAIVAALGRVAEAQPELGRHLYERVSTGATCRYRPDPANPITWLL
ncbi:hypothetical protein ODJ79_14540 [Actinoplanes sp. KI2]|uniref:hypothetical protein n=1 Tax=Actinoplanes sp. KI2 TaxID=2983315 RepID=UPI0021D58825|nr:hypothetical protein [Actinoplanes sp. KI2]MCU7724942.1 hypothetical protein [Actinoplanes sp. KI2]